MSQGRLSLNGKLVPMVSNQWDLDLDWPETTQPIIPDYVPEVLEQPKCECGAEICGIKPYMKGHSDWCPISENRTPLIYGT